MDIRINIKAAGGTFPYEVFQIKKLFEDLGYKNIELTDDHHELDGCTDRVNFDRKIIINVTHLPWGG